MGSAVRALLLDAVGTVIRLREPPARVYARVAESHGIGVDSAQLKRRLRAQLARLPSLPLDGLQLSEVPEREREGWRSVVREALGDTAADGPCFDSLFTLYGSADAWEVVPRAPQALDLVRARDIRIAIVSNMDARVPNLLEQLGLAGRVDEIVIPSNCGLAKPDPRIFHIALERLEVSAAMTLYIGDRELDCVDAARAAGLRALRYDPAAHGVAPDVLGSWDDLSRRLA